MSSPLTLSQALEAAGFTLDPCGSDGFQLLYRIIGATDVLTETECWAWLRGVLYERERQAETTGDYYARLPHGATLTPTEILERIGEVE